MGAAAPPLPRPDMHHTLVGSDNRINDTGEVGGCSALAQIKILGAEAQAAYNISEIV